VIDESTSSDSDERPACARASLPFGSEFSPSQIDLRRTLELIDLHEGNQAALQAAILTEYFSNHGGTGPNAAKNRGTLAMNSRLGLKAYGIIDDIARFTSFGRRLFDLRTDQRALHETLARHILLNLHGMALVQCIRDMIAGGEDVDLNTLRPALAERGVDYPSGGKHPSMMRLWLAKSGIFVGSRWQIEDIRLQEVLGTDSAMYRELSKFTTEQRAFLRALANTGITQPQPANEIVKLAAATYGVRFPEKSLPKLVLNALVDAGYITAAKATAGCGAKPIMVAPTAKITVDLIEPLFDQLKDQTDPKLIELFRKPLAEVRAEVQSADIYVKGLALEAIAFKLMRLVDMEYMATRLRASATGGAEVDLIFQSTRLVYSRWQVQCKNTARVSLDDIAKEVGLAAFIKSNVIVIVTTGTIGGDARRYVNKIMRDSSLAIVMLDGADLDRISANPSQIVDVFNREARMTMELKKLDLDQ
jgi:site-specific DNA-methyltransferase (cytosine-N4-specific)